MYEVEVQIPYTTKPYMVLNKGKVFNYSPDPYIIEQKKIELEIWKDKLYGTVNTAETIDLINLACVKTSKKVTTDIVEFALNFEEDVAIMHKGILQGVCFCFPSGWTPKSKVGQSLWDIHASVADSDKLVKASKKISETMASNRSFYRTVWTITNSQDLNQLPDNFNKQLPQTINDLWFRTEIQTTLPLENNHSSLFFVRVQTYPLNEILKQTNFSKKIYESICSMSDNILKYKNLVHIKQILDRYYKTI